MANQIILQNYEVYDNTYKYINCVQIFCYAKFEFEFEFRLFAHQKHISTSQIISCINEFLHINMKKNTYKRK